MSAFPWIILEQGLSATAPAAPAAFRPRPGRIAAARERLWALAGGPELVPLRHVAARGPGEEIESTPVAVGPMGGLRHTLRAMASEAAARRDPATVIARIRPMVEASQRELEEQLRRGAPRDAVAALHSRLIDHAVVGLFHLARFWAGIRTPVAPLTAVAVGGYGESLVLPAASPEFLLLVPEGGRERGEAERMATHLVEALRNIGFAADAQHEHRPGVPALRPRRASGAREPLQRASPCRRSRCMGAAAAWRGRDPLGRGAEVPSANLGHCDSSQRVKAPAAAMYFAGAKLSYSKMMTGNGELYLAQEDGGLPTTLAAGSARGESGVSVHSMRFRGGAHFSATHTTAPRLVSNAVAVRRSTAASPVER